MNNSMFVVLLFSLQLFYWFIGSRANKTLKGTDDYYLAGKGVTFFPLMMTFLATQVGGGVILGAADEAFRFGWPVLLYPMGAALGLMLLGCGVGRRLSSFQVSTVAQIFEVVYGLVWLKRIASMLSIVSLFMILVAQIIASNKFLVSLGCDNAALSVAFWLVVMFYTTQGGLKAVISTDLAQAAVFTLIFLSCFSFVLLTSPDIARIEMPNVQQFTEVSPKLCGWLLMPLLFMVIEQDMGQRCFAGCSPKVVSRASFWAGICTMAICVIPIFFGQLAVASGLEVPQGASVLMTMVAKSTTPWITALVGCAIMAAIISTATSLINAISANVAHDFFQTNPEKSQSLRAVRIITAFIALSALFGAFFLNDILEVLILSYELSVSCLFVPLWMALFGKNRPPKAAVWSMGLGALSFMLFQFYPITIPRELVSIGLSWLGFYAGTYNRRSSRQLQKEAMPARG